MIKTKPNINFADFMECDLNLLLVLHAHAKWCERNNKDLVITSIKSDYVPNRKSFTHLDGRAYDSRCNDWSEDEIKSLETYLNDNLGGLGAFGEETGEQRLVVVHGEGKNRHFHIQTLR